jgi:hypothetical protein
VLLGCRWVYDVVENVGGTDSRPAILGCNARIVAIGSDWARRDYYAQMGFDQDWLDEHGLVLAYVPYSGGISSTIIRRRLCT